MQLLIPSRFDVSVVNTAQVGRVPCPHFVLLQDLGQQLVQRIIWRDQLLPDDRRCQICSVVLQPGQHSIDVVA